MLQKKMITLEMASRMADAAEAKALELKIQISIAIIDESGNLKYFRRMDRTSYGSVRISQLKGRSSASLPFSTKALGERSAGLPGNPYGGGAIPDLLVLQGGLPILTSSGEHLGGVGVSGATSEQDEKCSQAALDAIRGELASDG